MADEKNGRILDKKFEEGITKGVSDLKKEAQTDITKAQAGIANAQKGIAKGVSDFQKGTQESIDGAQEFAHEKNDEIEAAIREHPKSYVAGSFVGGVVVGSLLSKGSK